MDCKEFSHLLDAYVEETLPEAVQDRMRAHEKRCSACREAVILRKDLRALHEETEMPDEFALSWRRMIAEETGEEKKKIVQFPWKNWIAAAAAFVFILGGTLLTRGGNENMAMENGTPMMMMASKRSNENGVNMAAAYDHSMPAAEEAVEAQMEKIIRTASFTLKTLHFEEDLEKLQQETASCGGRVEYFYVGGDREAGEMRSASLTLRIPSEKLDGFLEGAGNIGRITSQRQEKEDVSDSYYDVKSRLETQQKKMERLLLLMEEANQVSDLVEIENAIADTQYQIDRYTAQLQNYDSRVDYSTVYATVQEIRIAESEETGLGEKILSGLKNSVNGGVEFLKDALVFVISALPWAGAAALLGGGGYLLTKKIRKIRKER